MFLDIRFSMKKNFHFKNGFLIRRKSEQVNSEVIHMFPILPRRDNDLDSTNNNSSVLISNNSEIEADSANTEGGNKDSLEPSRGSYSLLIVFQLFCLLMKRAEKSYK